MISILMEDNKFSMNASLPFSPPVTSDQTVSNAMQMIHGFVRNWYLSQSILRKSIRCWLLLESHGLLICISLRNNISFL